LPTGQGLTLNASSGVITWNGTTSVAGGVYTLIATYTGAKAAVAQTQIFIDHFDGIVYGEISAASGAALVTTGGAFQCSEYQKNVVVSCEFQIIYDGLPNKTAWTPICSFTSVSPITANFYATAIGADTKVYGIWCFARNISTCYAGLPAQNYRVTIHYTSMPLSQS
jgi:hypothetical protein